MFRFVFLFLIAGPACADYIAANAVIRPKQVISPADLKIMEGDVPSAFRDVNQLIGKEASVLITPGRPILKSYITEPAIVERNDVVEVIYENNALMIKVEGRSLSRGAVGDRIRVMNLESRATVYGTVAEDGRIIIR